MLKNVIVIQGPPGSGKTELVKFMVRNIHPQSVKVVYNTKINFGKPLEAVIAEGLTQNQCDEIYQIAKIHTLTQFLITTQCEFKLTDIFIINLAKYL